MPRGHVRIASFYALHLRSSLDWTIPLLYAPEVLIATRFFRKAEWSMRARPGAPYCACSPAAGGGCLKSSTGWVRIPPGAPKYAEVAQRQEAAVSKAAQ